ncbi:methionyl-tRNA formyltransferase [Parasphingorhabdus cellanae]|uniref:Methionyl-tRNA formyltransferase n=1 Tax=Parasphingorhabdus cellanae TaxID=2806553 RepID=A0ABX7T9U7_9SPHN|nr:methionyl-tRNA formyltransferase [Parasphingorhabdus cellanae]QTD57667.1 methionyl-tRNA formyltransferase [Parasphingorhabdus cellanae]
MRLAFMGTPEFAVPALRALHAAGHEIAAVYSQPPRRAGRGKKLTPSPVQQVAEELGLEVRVPVSLKNEEAQAEFAALGLDVAVVAAYGLILPQAILDAPKMGCLNIHGSLLPRWRGAAPVQRAILAGDEETGITIMQMEAGLDTGPMLLKSSTPVAEKTAGELTEELAQTGADLMVQYLASPKEYPPEAQDDALATYAKKITKEEARVNFDQPATTVLQQIRAFNPVPGAFFEFGGERYRIHQALSLPRHPSESGDLPEDTAEPGAADSSFRWNDKNFAPGAVISDKLLIKCGSGAIQPVTIQKAGKPKMALADFLNGTKIPVGTSLR